MRKLLLLGSLLATMAGQAQEAETLSFYWPGERVTELTDGGQYFIYNTAYDQSSTPNDRGSFLYAQESGNFGTLDPKQYANAFVTNNVNYTFHIYKKADAENVYQIKNAANSWINFTGAKSENAVDFYIKPWATSDAQKGNLQAKMDDGSLNSDLNNAKVWTVTENSSNTTAWNGNGGFTTWGTAHPYAFYTVKSAELNAEQTTCYREATNRNGVVGDFAFLLQQTFGLVKSGDQYFSNYPETAEAEHSSYANLVDGNDESYFHSSWSASGAENDPKHFLRAELPEAKSEFYFINKRRTNTNNNRPTSILIEGSNEANGEYETITTISNLPTAENEYYYISEKIQCEKAYKYIRFTPQATNNGERYFNYSEFYVLDANEETDLCISSMRDFYYTISRNPKDENFISSLDYTKYQALTDAQENLLFNLNSTEANTLLTENQNNHADVPALGQYPTTAYNAFETAISEAQTSDELTAAIKSFKFSINAPVFMINGAFNGGYTTTGKSIYYAANDATYPLRWDKATNKYDKTMLWKFAGSTSTTAEVGQTYTAMNMAENVYFWNIEQLSITETNPTNTEGIVLIKTAGYNNPVHADTHGYIVRWDAFAPTSASAWTIEYVGESFYIDQVNEEQLAAYAQLKTLVSECEPYSDFIGTGLGKFTCEGHDFNTALSTAKDIISKDFYANPSMDAVTALNELQAAKEALVINQPEPGKFYRIKGASGKYISSEAISTTVQGATIYKLKMTEATDKTTALFLSEDNRITTEKMQNMSRAGVHLQGLGCKYKFTAHQEIGKYVIKPEDEYKPGENIGGTTNNPLYDHSATTGAVDQVQNANDAKCAWTLEEVIEEDNQPTFSRTINSDPGYATLGAPVALNIPDGVKAYTVTVNEEKTVATLNEVTGGIIPAGCGVVLEKTGGEGTYNFTFAAEANAIDDNALVPLYAETAVSTDINAYILANKDNGLGFYQLDANSRTIGANKAYLVLPSTLNHVRSITIGGPTTGIEETVANGNEAEEYYDLQGRRVLNPTKGIYVTKSGKKVIINK